MHISKESPKISGRDYFSLVDQIRIQKTDPQNKEEKLYELCNIYINYVTLHK